MILHLATPHMQLELDVPQPSVCLFTVHLVAAHKSGDQLE